jgi:uncharacterized membrane protein
MRIMRRSRLPLLLILLAGTGLRLFRLGSASLWYDETVSVMLAGSPLRELLRHTAGDIHPPGYYLLLRGWLLLSGYPTGHADPSGNGLEFASAFLSLAAGVLLIALVYALARRVGGHPAALWAAGLVALSPFNLWYSQEVRMYTTGACLGALVLYALLRATGLRHPNAGTDMADDGTVTLNGSAAQLSSHQDTSEGSRRGGRFFTGESPQQVLGGQPVQNDNGNVHSAKDRTKTGGAWWVGYAVAAAAGMYTLYYFAFLLLTANLWVAAWLGWTKIRARKTADGPTRRPVSLGVWTWLIANAAAVVLYVPWVPVAWRQATDPPVPPWRTLPALGAALRESWTALSLGQSAPGWLWPALLLALAVYVLGVLALHRWSPADHTGLWAAALLVLATFGSLALILLASAFTPLYNVRYVFTYSAAFYVLLGAGLAWLWRRRRAVAGVIVLAWVGAAAVTAYAFWQSPAYQTDDLRAAVHYLESEWRPGDAVLVNAGYAYPALLTYWNGPVAWRGRLTELPAGSETDPAGGAGGPGLVLASTGHVDGDPGLGWGDPRSDFYAMPAADAARQLDTLFARYARVWQYRIYDTVNDPQGALRDLLAQKGRLFDDQVFPGEANLRVQGYLPRGGSAAASPGRPAITLGKDLHLRAEPLPARIVAGQTLYPVVTWQAGSPISTTLATSLRLVGPDGATWAQPPDEQPLGPQLRTDAWPVGLLLRETLALPIPLGTPPGQYKVELVVYDPATGRPWPHTPGSEEEGTGIILGQVQIEKPAVAQGGRPAIAAFGPLALVEAGTPATTVSPGDRVPVDLLWQAQRARREPLVVVIQLLDGQGQVVAGLEQQPLDGRYPTQNWASGELVRDRHSLEIPADLPPGAYRLVAGVYRAADRQRFDTRSGWFGQSPFAVLKSLSVR